MKQLFVAVLMGVALTMASVGFAQAADHLNLRTQISVQATRIDDKSARHMFAPSKHVKASCFTVYGATHDYQSCLRHRGDTVWSVTRAVLAHEADAARDMHIALTTTDPQLRHAVAVEAARRSHIALSEPAVEPTAPVATNPVCTPNPCTLGDDTATFVTDWPKTIGLAGGILFVVLLAFLYWYRNRTSPSMDPGGPGRGRGVHTDADHTHQRQQVATGLGLRRDRPPVSSIVPPEPLAPRAPPAAADSAQEPALDNMIPSAPLSHRDDVQSPAPEGALDHDEPEARKIHALFGTLQKPPRPDDVSTPKPKPSSGTHLGNRGLDGLVGPPTPRDRAQFAKTFGGSGDTSKPSTLTPRPLFGGSAGRLGEPRPAGERPATH